MNLNRHHDSPCFTRITDKEDQGTLGQYHHFQRREIGHQDPSTLMTPFSPRGVTMYQLVFKGTSGSRILWKTRLGVSAPRCCRLFGSMCVARRPAFRGWLSSTSATAGGHAALACGTPTIVSSYPNHRTVASTMVRRVCMKL